jgi:hypothetical protein
VIKAIERLRSNPDNKNARQTLKDAYPLAIETLTSEIDNLLVGNEPFKYAGIVERYERINSMADEVRHSPAARSLKLDIREYPVQLSEAKKKAAEEAYQAAENLLSRRDRNSAREAYYLYEKAFLYVKDYKDTLEKMEQAENLATMFVVVEDIPVPGLYKLNSDFFQSQIIAHLSDKHAKNFIVFVDQEESKNLERVDQVVMMQFDDFIIGSTKDKEVVKELTSKDSVKVGTATVDGRKVDVYDRVKASFSLHTRQVISSGLLDVKVIDVATEKLLANQKFPGEYGWVTEWASYNGDKRALNNEQLKLSRKKPLMPPPPQDLFLEFTKPMFNQTSSFLNSFYRKY